VLQIIDAASRTLVKTLATGNNAHSVAVDPSSHQVFMPFSSPQAPAGCSTCATDTPVGNGGVLVFQE
jgi:hypothetical protein